MRTLTRPHPHDDPDMMMQKFPFPEQTDSMSVKHEHILNPVTALEFYRKPTGELLLLAGEGSFLKVLDSKDSTLVSQCRIFDDHVIHGISVRESSKQADGLQVVIWGGPYLVLFREYEFRLLLNQGVSSITGSRILAPDWILDVSISSYDNVSCALVTAHNTVLQARLREERKAIDLKTLPSPSRSILYSAHIIWESSSRLLIAAGTVFGEIIGWQCSSSLDEISSGSRILSIFSGHEGSIFGVNISPPIIYPDGSVGRLLASCSDDRTIRVWNIGTELASTQLRDEVILSRETGFGNNAIDGKITEEGHRCLGTIMGHASRIWRVKFLMDSPCIFGSSPLDIISFGEDSTTQQWALDVTLATEDQAEDVGPKVHSPVSASLKHLNTFGFHSGKHIWSATIYHKGKSKALISTGGADGMISLYCIESSKNIMQPDRLSYEEESSNPGEPARSWSWDLVDLLKTHALHEISYEPIQNPSPSQAVVSDPSTDEDSPIINTLDGMAKNQKQPKKAAQDAFNRYAFVSDDEVIVTTRFGRVLFGHLGSPIQWSELNLSEEITSDIKSYVVMEGFPEIGLVVLGGTNGNIYSYQRERGFIKVGSVKAKVADMFKIFNSQTRSFDVLVTTLAGVASTPFSIELSPAGIAEFVQKDIYGLPENFIVTSAGRCGDTIILGSRSGQLALYDGNKSQQPLYLWTPISHSASDAITTILPLSTLGPCETGSASHFLTTSRDGIYSIFSLVVQETIVAVEATVHRIHHGTPPFGPLIESAWFQESGLFLYGFKSKNFIVWNETLQCEIINVECGGANRSYAYSPLTGVSRGGHFIYTKASRMYLHSHRNASHNIVKTGGHGREIKACVVSSDRKLLATAAEDTTIRILSYYISRSTLDSRLNCQTVIQKHTAGIQHLQWYQSDYLFSSGGNGEFFVWAVEQIPNFGIGVICEAALSENREDRDLRVMSFNVTGLPGSSSEKISQRKLLISLAYSDSTIKTFGYSKQGGFIQVARGRYKSSCLMEIRHIELECEETHILTAATDGTLSLWRAAIYDGQSKREGLETAQYHIISSQKLHQNSIKSLDMIRSKDYILVATGGDDNALGISIYSVSGLSGPTAAPSCFILRSAHAAAITGVCIAPHSSTSTDKDMFNIVSSGNDQRVKTWVVRVIREDMAASRKISINIKRSDDVFTSVADVGDMTLLGETDNLHRGVLAAGNGMEIWSILGGG